MCSVVKLWIVVCFLWARRAVGFLHRPSDCIRRRTRQLHNVPSWKDLEAQIGESMHVAPPLSVDPALAESKNQPSIPPFSTERPTLFRERHGWCPYSERVWLALELCTTAPYDTVRIDNTGGPRPSYYGGQTPQMKWPDGRQQGESMDLVDEIDKRYNEGKFQSQDSNVQHLVAQFRNIFPRARPSSRAAFLFQFNGDPLWKSTFETTLADTNALLAETDGPLFAGNELTAADIAWAPFLERYRYQLPCLHAGLEPNDATQYPHLAAWYQAMDQIPAYACRVKGDASSWRKVLTMAGFGNAGLPPQINQNMQDLQDKEIQEAKDCLEQQELWTNYAKTRPHVADTPAAEAARIVTTNRDAIIRDTIKRATTDPKWKDTDLPDTAEQVDETLREMVDVLLQDDWDLLTNASRRTVGSLAAFLDERMCVPRDMGCLPAASMKVLAWNLQTFN